MAERDISDVDLWPCLSRRSLKHPNTCSLEISCITPYTVYDYGMEWGHWCYYMGTHIAFPLSFMRFASWMMQTERINGRIHETTHVKTFLPYAYKINSLNQQNCHCSSSRSTSQTEIQWAYVPGTLDMTLVACGLWVPTIAVSYS